MLVPDLAALVLRLRATRPSFYTNHMGRAVYALGLSILQSYDEQLSKVVHDFPDEKPFTASGLMRGEGIVDGTVEVGELLWVRFGALDTHIVAALSAFQERAMQPASTPLMVSIDHLPFEVVEAAWDDSCLPGLFSYNALVERHRTAPLARSIHLRFLTATTFRRAALNINLPQPDLVFGSLLTRWMCFTSHMLHESPPEHLEAFIKYHIALSRYATHSALYRFNQGGKEVGFLGQATFELMRSNDHLAKQQPTIEAELRRNHIWYVRTLHLLADFAYYSGLGRKTTTGMGMVRPT
jgi:CRISPR-associated endoribonuclease Cas6